MVSWEEDTLELDAPWAFASRFFAPDAPPLRFDFGAVSDRGRVRSENEDSYLVLRRTRAQEALLTSIPADELELPSDESHAMVVADGIGGSAFGGLASQLAVRTMWDLAGRAACWIMRVGEPDSQEMRRRYDAYAYAIQQAFARQAEVEPATAGMGTTWTCAYLVSNHAIISHLGDSRAYLWRKGRLRRITKDHTLAQEMMDAGVPRNEVLGYRHMLTRSLGTAAGDASVDIYYAKLEHEDRLLLCTDGLTNMVGDREMESQLASLPAPQEACDALRTLALERGGKDNITIVIARVEFA